MSINNHIFIILTVIFTCYSQLIIKWQVSSKNLGNLNILENPLDFIFFLFNPWVISAILATFLAGLSWIKVLSKFDLNYAFPFISLNFIIMLFCGYLFFGESLTISKIIGNLLLIAGLLIILKGF